MVTFGNGDTSPCKSSDTMGTFNDMVGRSGDTCHCTYTRPVDTMGTLGYNVVNMQ